MSTAEPQSQSVQSDPGALPGLNVRQTVRAVAEEAIELERHDSRDLAPPQEFEEALTAGPHPERLRGADAGVLNLSRPARGRASCSTRRSGRAARPCRSFATLFLAADADVAGDFSHDATLNPRRGKSTAGARGFTGALNEGLPLNHLRVRPHARLHPARGSRHAGPPEQGPRPAGSGWALFCGVGAGPGRSVSGYVGDHAQPSRRSATRRKSAWGRSGAASCGRTHVRRRPCWPRTRRSSVGQAHQPTFHTFVARTLGRPVRDWVEIGATLGCIVQSQQCSTPPRPTRSRPSCSSTSGSSPRLSRDTSQPRMSCSTRSSSIIQGRTSAFPVHPGRGAAA